MAAFSLVDETGSVTEMLSSVKLLYQIAQIPNHVKVHHSPKNPDTSRAEQLWDPDVDPDDPSSGLPFPENDKALELGISVEFRNVSFMYPGSNAYALRNISFKIEQGQLCVGSFLILHRFCFYVVLFRSLLATTARERARFSSLLPDCMTQRTVTSSSMVLISEPSDSLTYAVRCLCYSKTTLSFPSLSVLSWSRLTDLCPH